MACDPIWAATRAASLESGAASGALQESVSLKLRRAGVMITLAMCGLAASLLEASGCQCPFVHWVRL